MIDRKIFFTKHYFKYYCDKNKHFFEKINRIEQKNNILNVSFTSLERYRIVNSFLIDNNILNKELQMLDFGCYIGLYIKFLQNIGINGVFGIDLSDRSIKFGKKIGIKNLIVGDITNIEEKKFKNNSIDFISCLHVFEYSYLIKNGESFIYNTLSEGYRLLKKGGILFFSIGEGYKKFDKKLNKYINIDGKVYLNKAKIIEIGFSKLESYGRGYYIVTK